MKQTEKTKQSCDKILKAAVKEFGSKGYASGSLNSICAENGISKGLIYHNFKNKDELYSACVKKCFREIIIHLQNEQYMSENVRESFGKYIRLRQEFFRENPDCGSIFFQALLQPPEHLKEEIQEARREFDLLNTAVCKKLLGQIRLREGITEEAALEYFTLFREVFNGYFQKRALHEADIGALAKEHEMNLNKILDFMLYGIAKEESE